MQMGELWIYIGGGRIFQTGGMHANIFGGLAYIYIYIYLGSKSFLIF
jgi:hypothetical protein